MTREEAIAELKRDIELDNDFIEKYINAENMAIKALEQEPFINKHCISKGVCHEDKNKILDKISAYNVDIAFNSLKSLVKESRDKE